MNEEHRRQNLMAEIRRGRDALASARVLLGADLRADAVSRAYYAAFHHARALLLTDGQEPGSHGSVLRLLHRDFVRAGRISSDVVRLLSSLQQIRHDADYTAEFAFSASGAAEEVDAAVRFIEAIEALLRADGWIEDT